MKYNIGPLEFIQLSDKRYLVLRKHKIISVKNLRNY